MTGVLCAGLVLAAAPAVAQGPTDAVPADAPADVSVADLVDPAPDPSVVDEPPLRQDDGEDQAPPATQGSGGEPEPGQQESSGDAGLSGTAGEAPPEQAGHDANAALQGDEAKKAEQDPERCLSRTNRMLSAAGIPPEEPGGSWGGIAWAVAAGALLLAGGAHALQRRRKLPPGARASTLEVASVVVAISGGITGTLLQVAPSLAPDERPQRHTSLVVRDVDARITLGDYHEALESTDATARGGRRLSELDLAEIGNVVWLEVRLRGYAGKQLKLQRFSTKPGPGGGLLPYTINTVRMNPRNDDYHEFLPVWVGHRRGAPFRVQFRMVDDRGRVRELASTGDMPGLAHRYRCRA